MWFSIGITDAVFFLFILNLCKFTGAAQTYLTFMSGHNDSQILCKHEKNNNNNNKK